MRRNPDIRKLYLLAGLLFFAGCGLAARARPIAARATGVKAASEPVYQVYAIRYGTLKGFPLRGLVHGPDVPATREDIALIFWLAKGGGRNILFDSGFYRDQFMQRWKPADYVKPSEAIAKVGLEPEDITDVIISHAHWDHLDGADLFPKARVWIQKDEFDYYEQPAHQQRSGVFPADMQMLEKIKAAGRLELIDGDDQTVFPGIVAYTGGRHTYDSQYIGVHTRKGTVVLASDNVYLYMNLEKHLPISEAFEGDYAANLAAQDRMRKLASKPNLIVPGHDPLEFVKFPKPGNGVARIA
ncbi:MAG TPA: N-acyl homoserine lactonase family protein [Candidatus Acidoferrales bacterium]|nr:N-acyl homoserine lactonase family protein [Candidatus Acidoferrales bacterium]